MMRHPRLLINALISASLCLSALVFIACNPAKQDATPAQDSAKNQTAQPAAQPAQESTKEQKPVAASKRVYFKNLKDGASIKSPVKLVFGVEGMGVRPAGQDPNDKTTGHHHLIIDGAGIPAGSVVPMDATHIHYGKGQTETEVKLAPGKHSLRLQFADGAHRSYGPEMSAAINVVVTQ